MNYLFSFLVKIAISVLLMGATFNLWKSTGPDLFHWLMPIIALIWIVATIIEGATIAKKKKWLKDKEVLDERAQRHIYKAGFFAFAINLGVLFLLFTNYSMLVIFIEPINLLVILAFINTIVYYGIKLYLVYFD